MIVHLIELIKLILLCLPRRICPRMKRKRAKIFSKLEEKFLKLFLSIVFLITEMIAVSRDVDKDWSEFESYATNLYARTIVAGQPSSASVLVPSIARQEAPQTTSDTASAISISSNADIKAITDEITSIKKAVGDLRTYAEEVNINKV